MKSMMEEASSIVKAIENCWLRAGKPQEFTVRILEEPQKNFLGMTTKPAKIALFFDQKLVMLDGVKKQQPPQIKREVAPQPAPREQYKDERAPRPQSQETQRRQPQARPQERMAPERERRPDTRPDSRPFERKEQQPERPQPPRNNRFERRPDTRGDYRSERTEYFSNATWTPEMIAAAKDWVKESLAMMNAASINLSTQGSGNFLKIELSAPIEQDYKQEELLFKSWTSLIFESLRNQFKDSTRGLRLILESRKP
jgi:hypothetical protein